eukprot:comp16768_c0_seq1/m.15115 comp16768_c0_seq1/g.15115  ORF comp16768_c0_seq1/g.15115 comp16768_c0_seq1/m.15115 type:complete len:281 (-) comp16768_c0_seq1:570-1412(-)
MWQGSQGGGFMRGGNDGAGGDTRPAGPTHSCPPVSIKQVLQAQQDLGDDLFKIDGRSPNQVTFIGRIMSVQPQSTNVVYKIEDGTGQIDVKLWVDNDDNDAEAQKRAQWREGVYVRVVGQIRSFQETRSIVAYHIKTIQDFNEVTYHLLQTIHTHLTVTKGSTGGLTSAPTFGGAPTGGMSHGGMGAGAGFGAPAAAAPAAYGGGVGNDFENPLQRDVLLAIKANTTTVGADAREVMDYLRNTLRRPATEAQVIQTMEWLSSEGHIYSTVDETHFKPTDE